MAAKTLLPWYINIDVDITMTLKKCSQINFTTSRYVWWT